MPISIPVTVVVCTRDRPAELERCLQSLAGLEYPGFDVLVVDSAPRVHPAEGLARRFGASYVHEPAAGVSRARNRGARAASGEIVAMIDDEAVADAAWLGQLVLEFDDASVQAVAGRIVNFPAHTPEEHVCAALGSHDSGVNRRVIDRSSPAWFERTCFGGVGNGGNLAFRKSAFDTWPGFCEVLGAGRRIACAEEHYAFFQLVERGYSVVYAPAAVVSHPYPATFEALKDRRLRNIAASMGYITFLFFEQPAYRLQVLKYLGEALMGKPRKWRQPMQAIKVNSAPATWLAMARGLVDYVLVRLGRPFPAERPVAAPSRREASPAATSDR